MVETLGFSLLEEDEPREHRCGVKRRGHLLICTFVGLAVADVLCHVPSTRSCDRQNGAIYEPTITMLWRSWRPTSIQHVVHVAQASHYVKFLQPTRARYFMQPTRAHLMEAASVWQSMEQLIQRAAAGATDVNIQEPADRERRRILGGVAATAAGWFFRHPAQAAVIPLAEISATAVSPAACDQAIAHLVQSGTGREVFLIGTAHISNKSAALVRQTIQKVRPDLVMVELDANRINVGPGANIITREGRLAPSDIGNTSNKVLKKAEAKDNIASKVISQVYASVDKMGFSTGEEFAEAFRGAKQIGVPTLLGDQNVYVTLDHLSEALKNTNPFRLITAGSSADSLPIFSQALPKNADLNDPGQLSALVEVIKQREAVREITDFMRQEIPLIYEAMIGERDNYMATSLQLVLEEKKTAVGVVGIAHADGIERNLAAAGWKKVACTI